MGAIVLLLLLFLSVGLFVPEYNSKTWLLLIIIIVAILLLMYLT